MITLATLPAASAQEVFNQVANHLLAQGRRSQFVDSGSCAYRGRDGLRCAAGCLVSDDEYNFFFENRSWGKLSEGGFVPSAHSYLIDRLQAVHDAKSPEHWRRALIDVAIDFDLDYEFLKNDQLEESRLVRVNVGDVLIKGDVWERTINDSVWFEEIPMAIYGQVVKDEDFKTFYRFKSREIWPDDMDTGSRCIGHAGCAGGMPPVRDHGS